MSTTPELLALIGAGPNGEPWCAVEEECRHGRLPTDNSPPCGCFPVVVQMPERESRATTDRRAA